MIRLTSTNSDGIVAVEDLVTPKGWSTKKCREMIRWRRPGIRIISTEVLPDDVPPPVGDPHFHVTLRIPGRPNRILLSCAVNHNQASREAMASAPPGAEVVSVVPHRRNSTPNKKLSEDQIRELFQSQRESTESIRSLAARWGVSRAALQQVLTGKTHAHLRPEHLPPGRPSCERCMYYTGDHMDPCDLGFPDPVDMGLGFAADCAVFECQGTAQAPTA